jgi:hypothetical protein
MIVLIEDDHCLLFNELNISQGTEHDVNQVELLGESIQLLYESFCSRDNDNILLGKHLIDHFGSPADDCGLATTWLHNSIHVL